MTQQQQPAASQPELQPVNHPGKGQQPQPPAQQPAPPTKAMTAAKKFKEETFDKVLAQITSFSEEGSIKLPQGYSPENAMRAAWLILQDVKDRNEKPALEVCTPESICNALLKMVVWGLSPLKKQVDFIVRGNQLCADPEYTGNLLLAKRYGHLKDDRYRARAIFKGDEFAFEVDTTKFPYRTKVTKHTQKLENIGGEVVGAYFAYELEDGTQDVEIMNIGQIRAAWGMGGSKGNSPAHNKFSDQMAIKTVINRGTKLLIRASDDKPLFFTDDDDTPTNPAIEEATTERRQKANAREIDFEEAQVVEEPTPKTATPAQETPKANGGPDF